MGKVRWGGEGRDGGRGWRERERGDRNEWE